MPNDGDTDARRRRCTSPSPPLLSSTYTAIAPQTYPPKQTPGNGGKQNTLLDERLFVLCHWSETPPSGIDIAFHDNALDFGHGSMIDSGHDGSCHLRNGHGGGFSFSGHQDHLVVYLDSIRESQQPRDHQLGPVAYSVDGGILYDDPFEVDQEYLEGEVRIRSCRLTALISGGLWKRAPTRVFSTARVTLARIPSAVLCSRNTAMYSLPALCCDLASLVARSRHTMRQPDTLGSRVPEWPVFSTRSIRFIQLTTS